LVGVGEGVIGSPRLASLSQMNSAVLYYHKIVMMAP